MANPKRTVSEEPAAPNNGDEWEDIRIGLGDEWDFDQDGALIGAYLGNEVKQLDDGKGGTRANLVHSFSPENDPERIVFLWGSSELDRAFEQVEQGKRCRVQFLGIEQFTADDGPRQIKRYRVQVAK